MVARGVASSKTFSSLELVEFDEEDDSSHPDDLDDIAAVFNTSDGLESVKVLNNYYLLA